MAQFDNLWNNWYGNKLLNEMKPRIRDRVVAVSNAIKKKAGLGQLNDSYTAVAAFSDMFGDKLRVVGEYSTDDFKVMAKYLQQLVKLSDASLKDKQAKGFIKLPNINTSYFSWDIAQVKEERRRLREDGGGTYEVTIDYFQPFLVTEYIQTQNNTSKKEVTPLARAFNKFKMKEAADYWAKIQSKVTKDKEFIIQLTNYWMDVVGKSPEQDNVIVYSRAAIDVLRMSDHPNISSCHSQRGGYFDCAIQEAIRGGAIAYSVKKADLQKVIDEDRLQDIEIFADSERNIEGIIPDGRVRIRRMFDKDTKTEYALPEIRTYGNVPSSFRKTVLKWAAENQRKKFINPETNDFQVPDIRNAIKVGGSYNDNIPFELYADLAREVATTFGKNKQDIDIDRFHIQDVAVDQGQDLDTDCERRAGEIIREANFTDVKSLITISDFNVYCKKDGKVGIYADKATFYNNRDEFNEEFNEEFDRVEVLYSFGISTYYIKGKIKTDLTDETFKQIIEKTQEISPNGFLYRIYNEFGLKDKTFKIEEVNEWGERNVPSRDRNTKNNKYFSVDFPITYVDRTEIAVLNSKVADQSSYANFGYGVYDALEAAGSELGLIEQQPFNTPYAKRLFQDINRTDYMYYVKGGGYGGYIMLRSPTLAKRMIGLQNSAQELIPGALQTSFTNPRGQLEDWFYLYKIPKEALRASVTLATMKSHPGRDSFALSQLNQASQTKINVLYRNLRGIANDVKNDMLNVFPRAIMGAIELIPTVTEPRYMAREDAFYDDLNIVFSFKMSLSFNLDFKQQEETLQAVKYLYENFDEFKDSLEETLVDALRNSSFEDVKNLIHKYYVKGIEGSAPQAESKLDLSKEGILETLAEGVAASTAKQARKYWTEQNGNTDIYRAPFFSVLLDDRLTVRIFYNRTYQHKKVNPWEGNELSYTDFKIRIIPEKDTLKTMVFFYCMTGDDENRRWPAAQANVEVGNYGLIVEELSKFVFIRGYQMETTTLEKQKDVLAGYEDEMKFDVEAETKAQQDKQQAEMERIRRTGPVSQRKAQENEQEQMSLFERKQRNKLIKERLLNWYKRNK